MRRGDGEAGFTLIEILVVIVILGLVAALVAMHGPQRNATLDLRAAAQEVAQTLRLARARAIAGNRVVGVAFDPATHMMRLEGTTPRPLPPDLGIAVTAAPGNTLGQRMAAIRFAPDGSSSGGSVELGTGGRRARIGVDWLTGRVSLTFGA